MPLTLLPAVDVADGQVARLGPRHGDAPVAATDPIEAALALQAGGAAWIHLVDLDAAYGRGTNAELLATVVGQVDVAVELAGGIHDDASLAQALATGCARVSLSTDALADLDWCARVIGDHGDRVAVSLDVHVVTSPDGSVHHRLAARGGTTESGDLWEVLGRLDRDGCARYIVTDVTKDGRLSGPNLALYRAVTRATAAPVIASGGISALPDLVALTSVAGEGGLLEGAIVGTALAAGRFTLPEALDAVRPDASG